MLGDKQKLLGRNRMLQDKIDGRLFMGRKRDPGDKKTWFNPKTQRFEEPDPRVEFFERRTAGLDASEFPTKEQFDKEFAQYLEDLKKGDRDLLDEPRRRGAHFDRRPSKDIRTRVDHTLPTLDDLDIPMKNVVKELELRLGKKRNQLMEDGKLDLTDADVDTIAQVIDLDGPTPDSIVVAPYHASSWTGQFNKVHLGAGSASGQSNQGLVVPYNDIVLQHWTVGNGAVVHTPKLTGARKLNQGTLDALKLHPDIDFEGYKTVQASERTTKVACESYFRERGSAALL
eukprot:jgi/Mesvir1/9563/Mv25950-RA.1